MTEGSLWLHRAIRPSQEIDLPESRIHRPAPPAGPESFPTSASERNVAHVNNLRGNRTAEFSRQRAGHLSPRTFSKCSEPPFCFTRPRRRSLARRRRRTALCGEIQVLVCQQCCNQTTPCKTLRLRTASPRFSSSVRNASGPLNKSGCASRPLVESPRIPERWPQLGHCATCCSGSLSPRKRTGWGAARSRRARGGQLHRAQDARGRRRPR